MPEHRAWMDAAEGYAGVFAKCVRAQHAALIVDRHGAHVGSGVNGVAAGLAHCGEGGCERAEMDVAPRSDYGNCRAIHAEMNAIMRTDRLQRLDGTMYVTGTPCWECAKNITQSGLRRIVYRSDLALWETWARTRALLLDAEIELVELPPKEGP